MGPIGGCRQLSLQFDRIEENGKTTMNLRSTPHEATDEQHRTFLEGHESMKEGFEATFAQLAQYLARVQ
ncbi:hypothetical protein [Janthinobacterium sp. UMAB-56]|uniref:hypothetical protein n=1 Tax=Janthinobacterium sp. UMAB-56 TaxID=1365361 RepID=UPI001C5A1B72|nr:hypothetical protein [Janthinobacterium sp. UMAB-56]